MNTITLVESTREVYERISKIHPEFSYIISADSLKVIQKDGKKLTSSQETAIKAAL